jgi:hypothetical protein
MHECFEGMTFHLSVEKIKVTSFASFVQKTFTKDCDATTKYNNVLHWEPGKKTNQNVYPTKSLSKTAESQNSIVQGRKAKHDSNDEELSSKPLPYSPPCSGMNGNFGQPPMPALITAQYNSSINFSTGNMMNDIMQAAVEEMSADNLEELQWTLTSLPQSVVRCSVKLFDATPDQLPQDVQEALFSMLDAEPEFMQYNIRSGCVHLTIDAVVSENSASKLSGSFQQKVKDNLHKLFRNEPTGMVLTQFGSHLSVHELESSPGGDLKSLQVILEKHKESPVLPTPKLLFPLAIMEPQRGVKTCFTLVGVDLMRKQSRIICRNGLNTPIATIIRQGPVSRLKEVGFPLDEGQTNLEYLQCTFTDLEPGLHFMEMELGGMLSKPMAFIVCQDNMELITEIRQLERGAIEETSNIVTALGVIMESLKRKNSESSLANETITTQKGYLSDLAHSVAALAAVRGWPAMLKQVLSAIHPSVAASIITGREERDADLLYLATISRRKQVVDVLQSWAEDMGLSWALRAVRSASTVTPLHLSVLIDDQAGMAKALTCAYGKRGTTYWSDSNDSKASRETSPMMLAEYVGNNDVWNYLNQIDVVAGPSIRNPDDELRLHTLKTGGEEKEGDDDDDGNDGHHESWQLRIQSDLKVLDNERDATSTTFFDRRGILVSIFGLFMGVIVRWLIEFGVLRRQ